MMMNTE